VSLVVWIAIGAVVLILAVGFVLVVIAHYPRDNSF
jgi:hypothetical protein